MITDYNIHRCISILTGHPTTLSTHQQLVDSNNSQSVISNDHHKGNLTVTEGKFNISNGEAVSCCNYKTSVLSSLFLTIHFIDVIATKLF